MLNGTYIIKAYEQLHYYPFGSVMKGREWTDISASSRYRYGFNGKEKINEISGEGNDIDFGARISDSRLGRWMSTDPMASKYPDLSPYNFCANNSILYLDPDGKEIRIYYRKGWGLFRKNYVVYDPTKPYASNPKLTKEQNKYIEDVTGSLNQAVSYGGTEVTDLVTTKKVTKIRPDNHSKAGPHFDGGNTIYWDPNVGIEDFKLTPDGKAAKADGTEAAKASEAEGSGRKNSPARCLFHELVHRHRKFKGTFEYEPGNKGPYANKEEEGTVKRENEVYGNKPGEGGIRPTHRGKMTTTSGPFKS